MLALLETGQALYVLVGICVLGVLTRLMTRNLYKRLIKESTDLAAARNKGLKELRQRAENAYHMNHGMRDTTCWLEHQLGELRFRGLTLTGWANLSARFIWFCLLFGGTAAFFSYWYQVDTYYIVMYGGGSVLMAMLMMLLDGNYYISRRDQLIAVLQDHLENTMFPRMERISDRTGSVRGVERRTAADRGSIAVRSGTGERTSTSDRGGDTDYNDMAERAIELEHGAAPRDSSDWKETGRTSVQKSRLSERQIFPDRPGRNKRRDRSTEPEPASTSQEQTAATLLPSGGNVSESNKSVESKNWLKELGPEEAKVIGDILKQYLT